MTQGRSPGCMTLLLGTIAFAVLVGINGGAAAVSISVWLFRAYQCPPDAWVFPFLFFVGGVSLATLEILTADRLVSRFNSKDERVALLRPRDEEDYLRHTRYALDGTIIRVAASGLLSSRELRVRQADAAVVRISSPFIALTPANVKPGDRIQKGAGEDFCRINGVKKPFIHYGGPQ